MTPDEEYEAVTQQDQRDVPDVFTPIEVDYVDAE